MKVFVINGSPKGKNSNTIKLTQAFVEGLNPAETRQCDVAAKKIGNCRGCFACWNKTPGKCVLQDDMAEVIDNFLWADVIIWSFPLYYFNVPGILKNLIDRQLPMSLPFMVERTDGLGSGSHPGRFDTSGKRHVIISTCGFYSADKNYDSVRGMFAHICGSDDYEEILCGQGELFRVPELKERTDEYLNTVKRAGEEYATGKISAETRDTLSQLLYPKEVFEAMADASWGIEKDGVTQADESLTFTRQMALLYNKDFFDGKEKVIEMVYTDLQKTYQIKLNKEGSEVLTENFKPATTRIETPFTVWQRIARKEIRGDEALMQGLYRVTGDFNLMIHWDDYFGGGKSTDATKQNTSSEKEKKNPSLTVLLIPWIFFWVAVSINAVTGPVLTLFACAALPLLTYNRRHTLYDALSLCIPGALSAAVCLGLPADTAYVLSYLGFGLMWLLSCFTKEPLCAAYVKYNYDGDRALQNPLFMRPNYILAACWGVLYLITAGLTFMLYRMDLRLLSMIFNYSAPVVMGIFTGWFEKWYPAHKAGKGGR